MPTEKGSVLGNRNSTGCALKVIYLQHSVVLDPSGGTGVLNDGTTAVLLKPQTMMNLSGCSVARAAAHFGLSARDVVVFHDDIDLRAGVFKAKQGGSKAGHNGSVHTMLTGPCYLSKSYAAMLRLRSIDKEWAGGYWRIRVGIGRPADKAEVIMLRLFV